MQVSRRLSRGFTAVELLIVVAILGILIALVLFGVITARQKGADARIRNNVRQLRLLAEQTYDSNGASYLDWSADESVIAEVATVRDDIDEANGDASGAPYTSAIIDTRDDEFCISADLVAGGSGGDILCVDASGETQYSSSHCTDPADDATALVCPN